MPYIIGQHKWSHFKTTCLRHSQVNIFLASQSFFHDADRLSIERTCHTIHNKARSIFGQHRHFFPLQHQRFDLISQAFTGLYGRNDFYQGHYRRRIEEVDTNHSF
ncbi:hypothetical protein D9M68_839110 [compost metagenome]